MKKFTFTLDKLKSYREQILKREKNELGRLRSDLQTLIDERDKLKQQIFIHNNELLSSFNKGISAIDIAVRKNYLSSLHNHILEIELKIQRLEVKIEKQTLIVVEATRELKTLETLEEKQLDEYNFKLMKKSELEIEEFVSNASIREKIR